MEETSAVSSLLKAVERYFALMYDCDTSNFEKVFRSTAQLHGFREGKMSMWSAGEYKEILKNRESPKAQGAPREEQILMLDFASPTQALAKVRVRIGKMVFCDYLTYHLVENEWLITSKGYHLLGSN